MNGLMLSTDKIEIKDAPEPKEVILPLWEFDSTKNQPKITAGTRVITGEELVPGVFSTVTGVVRGIESIFIFDREVTAVRIELSDEDELDTAIQMQPDFLEQDPVEVLKKLNRANLGFLEELDKIDSVIVTAVDPDPLSCVNQQVFLNNGERVVEGLKLIKFLTSAKKVFLAVPQHLLNKGVDIPADLAEIVPVEPRYPRGLPEILLRGISLDQKMGKSVYIKVEKLVAAIEALVEGKPFVHKRVTVVDKKTRENIRVRIGTPVKEILNNNEINDNDKVIIGSPLRGYTCFNTEVPVSDDTDLLVVQDASEVIFNKNNPCINCGKCVRVCPVDLEVNLISRYSEFSVFEKCQELEVENCIECGLCAYYCPSRRSLVQLIRLAKKEIQNIEEEEEQ